MSPIADVKESGEGGTFVDRKGNFMVRYKEIAQETMKPKSPDSSFRESLRVVFSISGETDQTVSLSVTIEEPEPDLLGFIQEEAGTPPASNETALRQFIEANIIREPILVYVSGFIQSRQAPVGTHVFTRIIRIYQYNRRSDGQARLGMVAMTKDGLTTSWTMPEPNLIKEKNHNGVRGPGGDYIGLGPDPHAFQYLQMFGLDWERMKKEDLANAKAYWPGHVEGDQDFPVPSLFPSIENPWPAFLEITKRHGWKPVKMEIIDHPQYGVGPRHLAKGLVKMIEVDGGGGNAEFEREKLLFLELWENLTKVLLGKDSARFLAGLDLTDDGLAVAVSVLVPLVRAYPDAVKVKKPDGTPAVNLPPVPETWNLNGLVCANFTAERLMALSEAERFEIGLHESGLGHPSTPEHVLAWAAENVPEWAAAGYTEEGGVTL